MRGAIEYYAILLRSSCHKRFGRSLRHRTVLPEFTLMIWAVSPMLIGEICLITYVDRWNMLIGSIPHVDFVRIQILTTVWGSATEAADPALVI